MSPSLSGGWVTITATQAGAIFQEVQLRRTCVDCAHVVWTFAAGITLRLDAETGFWRLTVAAPPSAPRPAP